MATQTWTVLLTLYFLLLTIMLGVLDAAGILDDSIKYNTNPEIDSYTGNETYNAEQPGSSETWSFAGFLKTLWGFMVFGLDLGIGQFMWVIRAIFVYLPLFAYMVSIYLLLRGGE